MTYVVFARSPGVSLIYDCGQNSNRAKHLFHKWTEWYTLTAKREFSGCDLQYLISCGQKEFKVCCIFLVCVISGDLASPLSLFQFQDVP